MTPANKSDSSGIHFTRIMSRVDDPLRRNRECDVHVLRKSFSWSPNMNDIQLSSKHIIDENITFTPTAISPSTFFLQKSHYNWETFFQKGILCTYLHEEANQL